MSTIYRCQFCGRFYSSELPEATACPDHASEAAEKLRRDIARFNVRLPEYLTCRSQE